VAIPLRENALIFFWFGLAHALDFGWKLLLDPALLKLPEIDFKLLKFKTLRIDHNSGNYTTKPAFLDLPFKH
jgi:hypothetical protein